MPSFRQQWDLHLDGGDVRVTTNYADMLWAERAMGENPANAPMDLQGHVWYSALRRQHPEHPDARTFRGYVDAMGGADEVEPEDDGGELSANGLDPTPVAASDV